MKAFRVQWRNIHQAKTPWVDFTPDALVVAPDEASAVSAVVGRKRAESSAFINSTEPLRAVEISWEEYRGKRE